jgi:phosphinothricin acetyltransferase
MSDDRMIRQAAESHVPAIAAIYADAVLNGTASYEIEPPAEAEIARRLRELLAHNYPYFVAIGGGAVVGYAYAGPYRARPAYRYSVEDSVYVAPSAQRRGVGRALLGTVIEACEKLGFRQMIAAIGGGTEHPASIGLHKALGFRQIGVIIGSGYKHGRWLDTVMMQRQLGPGNASPPNRT